MEILCQLAESAGQVVLREQMMDEYGSDEGITRGISILRKAFKNVGSETKYIETIPKRGYRLLATVVQNNVNAGASKDQETTSLAVLPFLDLSENQDQGHLSDGVAEEIINSLAQLPFLRVSGRTSSFSFRGVQTNLSNIATALNVIHVLEGSVRKDGERLRINARLVEAANDKQVWQQKVDGTQDDIFDLQEKIAYAVEQKLRSLFSLETTSSSTNYRPTEKLTLNNEAYGHFLRGRHLMYELSGQRTLPRAIVEFEKAVALDPSFATAWANLAIANFTLPEYSTSLDWAAHIKIARKQTEHALELNPDIAWAHRARAGILTYDLKFDEAIVAYETAFEKDPNNPELMFTYAYIMAAIGLHKKADEMMEDAVGREPLLGSWYAAWGTVQFSSGNLDKAEALFRKSFDCNFGYGAILFSQLLTHRGRTDQALQFMDDNFDQLGAVTREQLKSSMVRKVTYAAFFKKSKFARFIIDRLLTKRMNNSKVQPALANIIGFIMIGRPEKFFQHVLNKPNPYVGFAMSRIWEPTDESRSIRTHENFPKFAETIGLVRAWQQYGWPENIQPNEGTDGSNCQFSCK
jgi:TolB-like protein/Tfp pilus assembly protein PilF